MVKQNAVNSRLSTSKTNIHKLLKSLGTTTRISAQAMEVLVSIERNLLERIIYRAHDLMLKEGKRTLKARTIQVAVRLEYSEEMSKHSNVQGITSVENKDTIAYKASFIKSLVKRLELFSRMSADSMTYLAGVIEYSMTEVIELAGSNAKLNNKATITPIDIFNAINNDEELESIFHKITIPQTGKGPIGTCGYISDPTISNTAFSFGTLSINDNGNDDGGNVSQSF